MSQTYCQKKKKKKKEPQKYGLLKEQITKLLEKSAESKLEKRLSKINILGYTPSEILNKICPLVGAAVSDEIVKLVWF